MKKYILIIAVSFIASFTYAQSDKEEIDLMQAAFGMNKKAAVAEFVKPSALKKMLSGSFMTNMKHNEKSLENRGLNC